MRAAALALSALLAAGCASFDGSSLVPGRSTRAEVLQVMGPASDEIAAEDGGALLYFSRLPTGRRNFVARLDKDGVLQSIEQRLTRESLSKLVSGTTTTKDVRALLGPPARTTRMERQARDAWEYEYYYYQERRVVWVQFSDDGVVQEVLDMIDWSAYPPSGRSRR